MSSERLPEVGRHVVLDRAKTESKACTILKSRLLFLYYNRGSCSITRLI